MYNKAFLRGVNVCYSFSPLLLKSISLLSASGGLGLIVGACSGVTCGGEGGVGVIIGVGGWGVLSLGALFCSSRGIGCVVRFVVAAGGSGVPRKRMSSWMVRGGGGGLTGVY